MADQIEAENETLTYLKSRLKGLKTARANYEPVWDRIARITLPTSFGFSTQTTPGDRLHDEIFDATAQLALPRFAAALDTLVTPLNTRWHKLVPKVREGRSRATSPRVYAFLEDLNELLFKVRYGPKANFASRANEVYTSLGAFGTGIMYVQNANPGVRYMALHLAEVYLDEDHTGAIDTVFWCHEYTVRQASQRFPDLPAEVQEEAKTRPDRKLKFCKAVYPRRERDPRRRDNRNMPFASVTFLIDGQFSSSNANKGHIVEETGYRTFPFAIARYLTAPREVYARGPGHDALADNETLQEMAKTTLRAGQLATDPSWLAEDENAADPINVTPGHVNYGWLGPDGRPRVVPMIAAPGDHRLSMELADQKRQAINGAFLVNLFQVLVETGSDRRTAYEVMQRVQEKGALLAPIGGRLRTEFLGTLIEREIDILFQARTIDPADVPEELIEAGGIDVEYDSPLSAAMRAEEGVAILRTTQAITQLAQIDPAVLKKLNVNRVAERLAQINGAPPDILHDEETMAAREAEMQMMAAAAQTAEVAPMLADTAKTLAEVNQMQGQTPRVI